MNKINKMLVLVLVVLAAGCGKKTSTSATQTGKPTVYATSYPMKFFAERIGGDLINVEALMDAFCELFELAPECRSILEFAEL